MKLTWFDRLLIKRALAKAAALGLWSNIDAAESLMRAIEAVNSSADTSPPADHGARQ